MAATMECSFGLVKVIGFWILPNIYNLPALVDFTEDEDIGLR